MESPTPVSPKVTAAALAAAIVTLIVWVADVKGYEINALAQGAITTVLIGVAAYVKRDPLRHGIAKRLPPPS